jgi:hypothetical protein
MVFLTYQLRRLKKDSAPDPSFKAALRAKFVTAPSVAYQPFTFMRYAVVSAVIALAVILGTGSYAYASPAVAEGTPLYSVKTGLENFEGSFKHSPEAQARFKARLMNRRIKEVVYRLRHGQVPPRALMTNVASQMNLTLGQLRELHDDPSGRTQIKTEIRLILLDHLNDLRAQLILSDLPDDLKTRYLDTLDQRIDTLENDRSTTP